MGAASTVRELNFVTKIEFRNAKKSVKEFFRSFKEHLVYIQKDRLSFANFKLTRLVRKCKTCSMQQPDQKINIIQRTVLFTEYRVKYK